MASTLQRAVRKASLASHAAAAAAAASHASAMASSRTARAAGVAAAVARAPSPSPWLRPHMSPQELPNSRRYLHEATRNDDLHRYHTSDDQAHLPDDAKTPTDKDFESDEAVQALYERWCKAFNKKQRRDRADADEMAKRFKIFRYIAEQVHEHNTYVPDDPEEAAIHLQKRREAELLLSKDQDVSSFDDCHLPHELGPLADGGDPCLRDNDYELLEIIEKREAHRAVKGVTLE